MTESVEVKLARLEEKVDTLLRQVAQQTAMHATELRDLKARMAEEEKNTNRLWGGLALATVMIPLIIRYLMGG